MDLKFQGGNTDPGTERNLLACVAKSQDAWIRLPSTFSVDDIVTPINRAMFIVMDSLHGKGVQIDPVSVYDSLTSNYQKELETLGGWAYIQALKDLPIDPENVEHEAKKLSDLSANRRIETAGVKIQEIASKQIGLDEKKNQIDLAINEIDKQSGLEAVNIASNGLEFLEKRIKNAKEIPGLPSGFPEMDKVTQGFQPGRLYVVGARKKTGKSMTLLNWAKYLAVENQIPILWISTEHSIDDEFSRLISLVSGVPEMLINNGGFTQADLHAKRVADALEKIQDSPFYFEAMPFFSLERIRRLLKKCVKLDSVQALFFDFIKLPEGDNHLKEWQELGNFTYGLKSLGASEQVPVITACQINREGQQSFKLDGEIDSDHFAGSDRIAQALSVAWVLRKPTKDEAPNEDQFRVLRITDNRHGPSGAKVLLDFSGGTSCITESKRL